MVYSHVDTVDNYRRADQPGQRPTRQSEVFGSECANAHDDQQGNSNRCHECNCVTPPPFRCFLLWIRVHFLPPPSKFTCRCRPNEIVPRLPHRRMLYAKGKTQARHFKCWLASRHFITWEPILNPPHTPNPAPLPLNLPIPQLFPTPPQQQVFPQRQIGELLFVGQKQ